MLIQKGLLFRSLGDFSRLATDRLIQPVAHLPSAVHHKARLLNILLFVETILFFLALAATFLTSTSARFFAATTILFMGAGLAYVVAKGGRMSLAVWLNALAVVAAVAYYNLLRGPDSPDYISMDFRVSCAFLLFPVLIAGATTRPRLGLLVMALVVLEIVALGVATLAVSTPPGAVSVTFYGRIFRMPLGLVLFMGLCSIAFEQNNLALFTRLTRRNATLKALKARLSGQTAQAENLLVALTKALAELDENSSRYRELAKSQEGAATEIEEMGHQLRQSTTRLNMLLEQATDVIGDSEAIVNQRAEVIRTNAAVYNRLQQLLELINHSVEELSSAAVQIEQVVGSISEVAEETNLLALNASIEAAGHLEQARRFTMVAGEVYRLAIRSRDAAEEVRMVASEVQASVAALAKASAQGRRQAQGLAQSARSAPVFIDQLTYLMDNLGKTSKSVFIEVKELQINLEVALAELPGVTARSEEITRLTARLTGHIGSVRQALDGLTDFTEPAPALAEVPARPVVSEQFTGNIFEPADLKSPLPFYRHLYNGLARRFGMGQVSLANRRRQARLINWFCLNLSLFMGGFSLVLLLAGFEIFTFLPGTYFLVALLVVYSFNRTGFQDLALFFFFGSGFVFYTGLFLIQDSPASQLDIARVGSGLLSVMVVLAVIVADLRWVCWQVVLSLLLIGGLAYGFIDRPAGEITRTLILPLSIQISVAVLTVFLYFTTNRPSARLERQNRELAVAARRLQIRRGRVLAMARQSTELIQEVNRLSENQGALSKTQLEELAGIVEKIENLELTTFQAGSSIQQIGLVVSNAREQVQQVMRETDEAGRILEGFRAGVGQIASNSQDLKVHAGEIGQIFELITMVADEIDLLALNATLEAAQAHEAGKRFGAVAGEIQRLAGRARQTGARVQMVISSVQEAVSLCTQLTERGHSELMLLTQSAYETTFSTRTVVEVVGTGQKLVGQVETISKEQTAALQELNLRLHEIIVTTRALQNQGQGSFETIHNLQEVAEALAEQAPEPAETPEEEPVAV